MFYFLKKKKKSEANMQRISTLAYFGWCTCGCYKTFHGTFCMSELFYNKTIYDSKLELFGSCSNPVVP